MMRDIKKEVVRVDGLTKRFGQVTAVDGASFTIHGGQVYALIGRNGSGKSTTVRCLLGQLKATRGGLSVFGLDSWRHRREIMVRVGVAPEAPDIPVAMTPAQVARFVAPLYPGWDSGAFRERLHRLGVPMNVRFSSLSKGQCKSVSLALALSSNPDLVILDDPTLGLDAVARKNLYDELIGELAERGTTVLVTTHDLAGIEGVADHVGIMHRGRVLLDDDLELIKGRFVRYRYPVTGIPRFDHPQIGDGVASSRVVAGVVEVVVSDPASAAVQMIEEGAGERLRVNGLSLEEIFIALCGDDQGELS